MKRKHATSLEKRIEDLKAENRGIREMVRALKADLKTCHGDIRHREEIYHAIPSVVAVVQSGLITDVNESATDQLGYAAGDLLGRSFLDIVYPQSRDMVREIHAKRLDRRNVPEQYEADMMTKSGLPLPCEVRVRKILLGGRRAFVVSLTPMGRRKEQEENRIQAKKMEAVLTMASALAVRFEEYCTEVRDQVRRLKGEDPAGEASTGQVIRALEAISTDALRMTGSLKTIARKEAAFPDAMRFDFRMVVKEAIAMGRSDWERRSGSDPDRFRVKTYLRSGSHILGDAEALRDVIARLIQNALEAMPGGGDLYVTSEESEGAAHLYIMDNGVGVSDTVRDRIFDPFFTTRQDGGATGLGLSVAYAVIRQHGGEIEVTSETSQGTEIHISVPLAPPEEKDGSQPVVTPGKPSRILLIGGASPLQELFSRVFSFRGWEVAASESSAEAFGRLRGESWGMVILEHTGNGLKRSLSVCRRIKALDPRLPVVLIVGDGAGDAAAGRPGEAGVVDLIVRKPLYMDRFQKQIHALLAGIGALAG